MAFPAHWLTMQDLRETFDPALLRPDPNGEYHCFFLGCGVSCKGNFARHVNRHINAGDIPITDESVAQMLIGLKR